MLVEQLYFSKIDERLTHLTPAQGNTCRWLLSKSEYTDWYNNVKLHDHCGFLWIKGNPGTGKSTLMKFLFENERSNTKNDHLQILLSFFFLARGTPEEKSTVGLYRSLLHQLFQKVPSLTESLNWMTPDGARVIQRGGWSEEALKQTLKHAAEKLGNMSLTMYIDALDECEDSQAERMIRFFEELCEESVGNIRICFTSRHYPHIEITTGTELTLEDEDGHKEDIQKYIKSNLKLGRRNQQTESLQSEILEKSSRIFLWVVLVIKILTELPDKSIRKMRERLQEIPTELAKLFEMILARDRKNLEQMKLCLSWVLFAIRPLKPQELYFAIQLGLDKACSVYWDTDDIDIDSMKTFVKSSSKGLVEVTRNKAGEVQFIHESVREFLLSEDGARWSGASGSLVGHGHRNLRDCCLAQINAAITQHVNIPDPLPKPAETDKLRETIASKFPFLEYSVLSILQHANSAQRAGMDQRAFVSDFPLPRWRFLNNAIEKFEVRRYRQTVTLLYILAERNLADLIHIHPHLESWLDVHDDRYGTPIFAARATGSHEAVKAILQAQIHEQPAGSSVRRLLERCLENAHNNPTFGRDFTFSRTKGVTQHVIEQGDEVVLNFLYSLGKVDPAWKEKKDGQLLMPLSRAAKNGHEGVVRFLLEKGAEVDWKGWNGKTALWEGASGGHGAVVKLLLKNGAEVDSKNISGETPLSDAAFKGHQAVVKLLLKNGAEVEFDNNGRTRLFWVAINANKDVAKLLLENGAEVELKDNNGRTLLSWAASHGREAMIELLLSDPRVDPEAKDNNGRTPLSWAASRGYEAVIKLLLSDPRVDPEAKDNNGRTPLSWAASHGYKAVIKILLSDHRVDPEAKDNDNRTPLSWAASHGDKAVIKILLSDHRVDLDAKDKDGRTPSSWAREKGYDNVARLLEGQRSSLGLRVTTL
jgi:ankyrin repeat protein